MTTAPPANEALERKTIDVIWNKGELDRLGEFYTDDFVSHQPKDSVRWDPGHEGLRRLISGTRARFPDYTETIEDAVAAGDRVVLRLTNRGTDTGGTRSSPASGRSFEVRDFMLVRMRDGKIAEQWGLIDLYSMYLQLGQIEAPGKRPAGSP
jgi:steroid delta-isomerase-like uncharacterized protein